jgi:hypothetical protein
MQMLSRSEDTVSHELAVCRPEENPTKSQPSLTLGSRLALRNWSEEGICEVMKRTFRYLLATQANPAAVPDGTGFQPLA